MGSYVESIVEQLAGAPILIGVLFKHIALESKGNMPPAAILPRETLARLFTAQPESTRPFGFLDGGFAAHLRLRMADTLCALFPGNPLKMG